MQNSFRDTELSTVCRKPGTLILYPGAEATNLEDFLLDSPVYPSTLILIDGTWSQAKDIFYKNSLFRLPKQVNECFWREKGQSVMLYIIYAFTKDCQYNVFTLSMCAQVCLCHVCLGAFICIYVYKTSTPVTTPHYRSCSH